MHDIADALKAVPPLIAFRLAPHPATTRFTYGYGRAEDLAGLFVIIMIALSRVLVGVAGFEPTASSSRTKRAAKLRYTPVHGRFCSCSHESSGLW